MANASPIPTKQSNDKSSSTVALDPADLKAAINSKRPLGKRDSGFLSPGTPDLSTSTSKLYLASDQPRSQESNTEPKMPVRREETQTPPQQQQQQLLASSGRPPLKKKAHLVKQNSLPAEGGMAEHHFRNSGRYFSQASHPQPPPPSHHLQQSQAQVQQHQVPQDGYDVLLLAFQCRARTTPLLWECCNHPYCVQVRKNWHHQRNCLTGHFAECKRCVHFQMQLYEHAGKCENGTCAVPDCLVIRQNLQQQFSYLPFSGSTDLQEPSPSQLVNRANSNPQYASLHYDHQPQSLRRRSSLTSLDVLQDNSSSLLFSLRQFESGNLPDDSPTARYIEAKAEEIVNKLNEEEPLLPSPPTKQPGDRDEAGALEPVLPPPSLGSRPVSLRPSAPPPTEDSALTANYPPVGVLSPIAESPTMQNVGPSMLGQEPSMPSMPSSYGREEGVTHPSMSLGGESEGRSVYPHQELLHKFRTDKLTVGPDGHYHQNRDYNANDDLLKSGGFGTIRFAEDLTTNHLFAIKCNNKDDENFYESIETEARMLARLRHHENVIQMFGAVVDDKGEATDFHPSKMYKLMMELAEHGTLSDMLLDYETGEQAALDCDQALYYFWQLLKGVDFLHKSGILHLDIKGANLLVFDEGRTLKICDFGTAVHVDEIASSIGKNLGTPLFASPEICRQQMPQFSSDMWSAMCVLIEMLTAKRPWDRCIPSEASYHCILFLVGQYKDENMERDLIPSAETLHADIIELMRLVFRAECKDRATAMELLSHPLIVNAYTYESCFDEALEELAAGEEEEQESCASQVSAPTSLPLSLNEDGASTGGSQHGHRDSGTGLEIQTPGDSSYSRMTSSGRNSDSGIDTPFTVDKPNSMFTFLSSHDEETDHMASAEAAGSRSFGNPNYLHPFPSAVPMTSDGGNFYSLPNPPTQIDSPIQPVQRSYSLTAASNRARSPLSLPLSGSSFGNQLPPQQLRHHQCSLSYSRLRHSNSAPVIGGQCRRRRLSLQSLQSYGLDESVAARGEAPMSKLRRTSSEVYVDKGPDIDSPERVRKSWVEYRQQQREQSESQQQQQQQQQQQLPHDHLITSHAHSEGSSPHHLDGRAHSEDSPSQQHPTSRAQQQTEGHSQEPQNTSITNRPESPQQREEEDEQSRTEANGESGNEGVAATEVENHLTGQGQAYVLYKTVC